jgi:putative salt-induced outer membrane protein YdiY
MRSSICLLALIASNLLFADQVTLKNGDVITGQIVKKDGDHLTLKSEFMGEVTMPWGAITSVKSDNPLYVVLPDGSQVNGKIATEASNVEVQTPNKTATSPLGQVSAIRNADEQKKYERLLTPSWKDLWAGYFDLGFALARGNARTDTLTTGFVAARVTNHDKTALVFNQIYSTARINGLNGTTADAARGGISYSRDITPRVFFNVQNEDEYDTFQSLNFRFTAGPGIGFHAIKNEKTVLDLLAGGDYMHESFTDNTSRNFAEVNGGDDLSYKLSGVTSLTQSFRVFDAPGNGEYRLSFDLGAATTIRKWLSWQVSASDRFLSAPIFGRKRNDILLTTGVRVTFAR